jgi:ABC-type antimicrobial peptide transport system permease subunit
MVQRRRSEIGIRVALGADARQVRQLMLRQGIAITSAGVTVGVVLALLLSRVLARFLFGVTPYDPLVFVTTPVLLGAVALCASWLPARRASRIDPMTALRCD